MWEVAIKTQIQLKTGIYDFEKASPQAVLVEVLAQKSFTQKGFINYETLLFEIENLQNLPHKALLEEWAIFLADAIFKKTPADALTIKMQKLTIFKDRAQASVALCIERHEISTILL